MASVAVTSCPHNVVDDVCWQCTADAMTALSGGKQHPPFFVQARTPSKHQMWTTDRSHPELWRALRDAHHIHHQFGRRVRVVDNEERIYLTLPVASERKPRMPRRKTPPTPLANLTHDGAMHLTVNPDGVVSLWDRHTETEDEVYVPMQLTGPQLVLLRDARDRAKAKKESR